MAREQDGVVVEESIVPVEVKLAAMKLHAYFHIEMYGKRSKWNSGEAFERMRDASDFINQFVWED